MSLTQRRRQLGNISLGPLHTTRRPQTATRHKRRLATIQEPYGVVVNTLAYAG